MTAKRILFTGGSGKSWKACRCVSVDQGYSVLNVGLTPLGFIRKFRIIFIADINDSWSDGQTPIARYAGLMSLDLVQVLPTFWTPL